MHQAYEELIRQFVHDEISADDFEAEYIRLWYLALDNFLSETTSASSIISDLFLDVDCYSNVPGVVDPVLCLDENGLREAAQRALDQLTALQTERDKSA